MVSCEMVVRSVQVCWRDEFAAAPTIYPGQQIDTSGLAAWAELWVDAWDEAVRRDISPDQQWVWLTVHCFTREPLEATHIHNLAATARGIISRRTIDVRDFSLSGEPLLARLRMHEAEARDLTRDEGAADRGVLRHVVVTCRGRLEETVP
jgi:hypothetical protein